MKRALASLSVLMMSVAPAFAGHGGGCHHGGGRSMLAPVVFLLTLVLGYWVLRLAEAEKVKVLRIVGRIVAWIVLLASLVGLLCPFCGYCKRKDGSKCGMGEKSGMMCPYSGPTAEAPAAEPAPESKKK